MSEAGVALIGCGAWGKNHLRVWSNLGCLRVVCDPDPSRLEMVQTQHPGVETCTDVTTVLNRADITGVVIAAPAFLHAPLTLQALEAGKDVLVEKPMALTTTEGKRLVETARRLDRILMVGHVLEYHPAIQKLHQLVDEGTLGRIQYIYSNRLNLGRIRTEENALWSFAPHDIALMLRILDIMPEEVTCHGGAYLNYQVADVTMTNLNFPNNVRGHIFVSWLHPFKEQRFVVVGERQMAVFDDTRPWPEKLALYPHRVDWVGGQVPVANKAEATFVLLEEAEPLQAECEHFLHRLADRQQPLSDSVSGQKTLQILEVAQRSLEQGGQPIKLTQTTPTIDYYVHPTATVDEGAMIGQNTRVWHYSHIMPGAQIGTDCVLAQNVFVGDGVRIGNQVKVQNNVSVYKGVVLEDGVFCGPSMVFTNVINPRSEIERKQEFRQTLIKRGATLGANCTIMCGVTIGRYAFVGAGAVVTGDVPDYALMVGVPAVRQGWMSRHGHRLPEPDAEGIMVCPESNWRYRENESGVLNCMDWPEEQALQ
jgi:UDP-2-acetamido-3-amino-2,3-dideoxy-glucuronate N-acetyltransferase